MICEHRHIAASSRHRLLMSIVFSLLDPSRHVLTRTKKPEPVCVPPFIVVLLLCDRFVCTKIMNEQPVCIDLISDDDDDDDEEESLDGKLPAKLSSDRNHNGDSSTTVSPPPRNVENAKPVPVIAIDLTTSSDDEDDDDDNSDIECYKKPPPATQQRRYSSDRDEYHCQSWIARKEAQERSDEALARALAAQEEARGINSDDESSPLSLREMFPDPATTLSALRESDNEYQIVAEASKDLEARLGYLLGSQIERRTLGWKISKVVKQYSLSAIKVNLEQIVTWRNALMHQVKQLSDIGTTKNNFLDAFARVLHSMADLRPKATSRCGASRKRKRPASR